MNGVAIIVPNWNGLEVLENLLGSLRAQTYPIAEILVVDNGSTDGSADAAGKWGARVIRLEKNFGFSAAVNRGIAESRTDCVAIVNNDVSAARDWLACLVEALSDETAWFATGKILQSSGESIDGTYDAVCRGACAWRIGNGRPDSPQFSIRRRIFFPSGTAALFRRDLFHRIGLFDEAFESYLEDVDLGFRCALAGLGGWYVPEAVAWHRGSATLGRWHPRAVRLISRNQALLVAKHYPAGLILRLTWPILIAQFLWGIVALRHGAGWAWLRGKLAAIACVRRPLPNGHSSERQGSERRGSERRGSVTRGSEARGSVSACLRRILEQSESEIFDAQSQTGFDPYWRWYFRLTGSGGKKARV